MPLLAELLSRIHHGLIVSCQALPDEPLHGSQFMAAMARAAAQGGACGLRANSPDDIHAIRAVSSLPLIGLWKVDYADSPIYITPTMAEIRAVVAAGANIVAVDATARRRPGGASCAALVRQAKSELGVPILADVATVAEGLAAAAAGADLLSTTMSGYTPDSPCQAGPDFELLAELVKRSPVPVIAEGRFWTPAEARKALSLGAHAVVVGSAITRPQLITARFVRALQAPEGLPPLG